MAGGGKMKIQEKFDLYEMAKTLTGLEYHQLNKMLKTLMLKIYFRYKMSRVGYVFGYEKRLN